MCLKLPQIIEISDNQPSTEDWLEQFPELQEAKVGVCIMCGGPSDLSLMCSKKCIEDWYGKYPERFVELITR
jgi:hypothetical protein